MVAGRKRGEEEERGEEEGGEENKTKVTYNSTQLGGSLVSPFLQES